MPSKARLWVSLRKFKWDCISTSFSLYIHSVSSLPSTLPYPPFPLPGKIFDGGRYHAGKSRIKKEKTEIVAIPFLDGMALFIYKYLNQNLLFAFVYTLYLYIIIYYNRLLSYYTLINSLQAGLNSPIYNLKDLMLRKVNKNTSTWSSLSMLKLRLYTILSSLEYPFPPPFFLSLFLSFFLSLFSLCFVA